MRAAVGALLATVAFTWAAGEGWLGAGGGAARVLLVPAAACVAVLVGLGVSSMAREVSGSRLGWRQLATIGFAVVALAGLLPVLGAAWGGRWDVPQIGYDSVLTATGNQKGQGRELWLGAPLALPLVGWQVRPGFAEALTVTGLPDATALWPNANPGDAARLAAAVDDAELGRTVELGKLLAPGGVKVIVVPTAFAPVLPGVQSAAAAPPPANLIATLAGQLDLRELPSEGGTYFFENTSWRPDEGRGPFGPGRRDPGALRDAKRDQRMRRTETEVPRIPGGKLGRNPPPSAGRPTPRSQRTSEDIANTHQAPPERGQRHAWIST